MNMLRTILTMLCPLGFLQLSIFGSSKSSSNSSTRISSTDLTSVVESGSAISGGMGNVNNVNSTDAVKAIAQLSNDAISKTGAAVVELNQASLDANVNLWDRTVTTGASLVDKLIDATTTLGTSAIDKFQPAENKAQDATVKLGMFAAVGLVAAFLLSRK